MNGKIGTLERGVYKDLNLKQLYADWGGRVSLEECMKQLEQMQRAEVWLCDEYQVEVDKQPKHGYRGFTIWHLSIKRRDKEPIHDWRDLQEIKNQLCGPEFEAVELYPSEDRKVDSANQFHLWAFMKDDKRKRAPMFPVGWTTRFVSNDQFINGKQRPAGDSP